MRVCARRNFGGQGWLGRLQRIAGEVAGHGEIKHWEGVNLWKVPQKITAYRSVWIRSVRVKMCGKSARFSVVMQKTGKPRLEQDKGVRAVVCSAPV